MNPKKIKLLNQKSRETVGLDQYCHKCGEECPGGLLDGKYCKECYPKCVFCAAREWDTKGSLVAGRVWHEGRQRWLGFRGYVCDAHLEIVDNCRFL